MLKPLQRFTSPPMRSGCSSILHLFSQSLFCPLMFFLLFAPTSNQQVIQRLNNLCQGFQWISAAICKIHRDRVSYPGLRYGEIILDSQKELVQQARTQGQEVSKEVPKPVLFQTPTVDSYSTNLKHSQNSPQRHSKSAFSKEHSPSNKASLNKATQNRPSVQVVDLKMDMLRVRPAEPLLWRLKWQCPLH